MIRCNALTLTAFLVAAPFACDKPGVAERQREEPANEPLAQARSDAAQPTPGAQAADDKDMSGAPTDFEKNREEYLHGRATDLQELDTKIVALESKEKVAKDKAKAELQDALSAIGVKRDAFVRDLNALHNATAAAWDEAKTKLEREWDALKAAVDKAPWANGRNDGGSGRVGVDRQH
jgi:hypothetical protein